MAETPTPPPSADLTERERTCLWPHLYAAVAASIYDAILADVAAALATERAEARRTALEEAAQTCDIRCRETTKTLAISPCPDSVLRHVAETYSLAATAIRALAPPGEGLSRRR